MHIYACTLYMHTNSLIIEAVCMLISVEATLKSNRPRIVAAFKHGMALKQNLAVAGFLSFVERLSLSRRLLVSHTPQL